MNRSLSFSLFGCISLFSVRPLSASVASCQKSFFEFEAAEPPFLRPSVINAISPSVRFQSVPPSVHSEFLDVHATFNCTSHPVPFRTFESRARAPSKPAITVSPPRARAQSQPAITVSPPAIAPSPPAIASSPPSPSHALVPSPPLLRLHPQT